MAALSAIPSPALLVGQRPSITERARLFCQLACGTFVLSLLAVGVFNAFIDPFGLYQIASVEGINAYKSEAVHRLRLYKMLAVRRVGPQAIVLGASNSDVGLRMTHEGWSPNVTPRYNLSLDGATLAEMHAFLLHAQTVHPLQQVVLAIDFLEFARPGAPAPDFDEALLSRPGDLRAPFRFFTVDLPLLLNRDSLEASLRTIGLQSRTVKQERAGFQEEVTGLHALIQVPVQRFAKGARTTSGSFRKANERYSPDGQELGEQFFHSSETFVRNGPRAYFTDWDDNVISNAVKAAPPGSNVSDSAATPYEKFRSIVDFCRVNRIDLRVFTSPLHARRWEIEDALGHWSEVESWKRRLVSILAADAAAHPAEARFTLYDFAGYSSVTTEPLPAADSHAEMQYYWDGAHYKELVGDWVLDRLFGVNSSGRAVPDDFGMLLDETTIDADLAKVRADQREYQLAHPAAVEEIRNKAARQRHAIPR